MISEQENGSENPNPKSAPQNPELQMLLWDQDELVKRVGLVMEARMLRALTSRYSSPQEVPESQYRRFEQFVFRIQTAVSQLREDVRDIFRSPATQDIALLAQEIQQRIRTAQTLIRDHVAMSLSKGNGLGLSAMQVAADALEQPIAFDDLEEVKVLEALDLPVSATLTAEQFFRVEKKPEPTVSATFDGSDPPNMWETPVAAEVQAEREKEIPAFRWSWTDNELFAHHKLPLHSLCRYVPGEIWLEAEKALTEGFKQWKQQCLAMLPSSERFMGATSGKHLSRTETLQWVEREFLGELPSYRKLLADNLAEGVLWKPTITLMETEVPKKLCTFCQIEGGPEPSFISDILEQYFSKLQEGTPMAFPLVQPSLVSDDPDCVGYIVNVPDRLTINRDTPAKIVTKEWGISKTKSLQTAIVEAIGEKYQTDQHRGNILHSTWEVSQLLQHAIERALEAIPWIPACNSQFGFIAFCKDILKCALEETARFQCSEISPGLLAEIKNASSFEVSRRVREFSLIYPLCFSWSQDERYLEGLRDFYPTPPETESYQPSSDQVAKMDPENVSSRPLTREELLAEWGAVMDRITVRMCKRGFIIMQDNSLIGIDLEDATRHGIEIIERFCSSGPVGKKRVRSLRKELMDAVQRYDESSDAKPKLRKALEEIMRVCMKELQQMFANIDACREHTEIAGEPPEAHGVPTLSSEFIQCVFLSAFEERRAHTSAEEKRLHTEAIADRRVDDAYNRWHGHVNSIIDGTFASGPDHMTLDQCLKIVEVLRRETEHLPEMERFVPDYWRICVQQNRAIQDGIERRLREKFAIAGIPSSEGRTERPERIPKQQFIGFISSLQRENAELYKRLDAMIQAMEKPTALRIAENSKLHLAQVQAVDAQLLPSLTIEDCRSHCERIRQLPSVLEGVPDVPDEFRRLFDEGQQWFDTEIARRLPELFSGAEQPAVRVSKNVLWRLMLDYQETGAPERVTASGYEPIHPDYERILRWCEQCLRSLYEDLPQQVTQNDCRTFIYAARAAMLPLEEACPFSASIRQEYKSALNRICTCAERTVGTIFAQQESRSSALQLPCRGRMDAKREEPKPKTVVQQSTVVRWWDAVREEAGRRLQVSVQESTVTPEQTQKAVINKIPPLPHGNGLTSARAGSTFIGEMQHRIEQLPHTLIVGGTTVTMPEEVREFLLQQLVHMQQGLLAMGWKTASLRRERHSKETSAPDAVETSASSTQPDVRAEQISDVLSIYNITPDQAAESLSDAIAGHIARAATEALTMQAQTLSEEDFERTESELRKGISLAVERARALLAPIAPGTITAEQLSAALQQVLEHATDGLNLPAETVSSIQSAIDECRAAVDTASTNEDLIEFLMERAGNGLQGFEDSVRMHRIARGENRLRQHGERIQQSQRQISAGLEQLTVLSEEYAEKARHGATEIERQDAAQEVEQIQGYIQVILGMYQGKTPLPHSAE